MFGAALSDDCRAVRHIEITDTDGLRKLRGSKYVQSSTGKCYQKAKEYLDKGRLVLYTGTPCQIQGLIGYLGKNYENLYTMDLICHGVPSQYVWDKYIDYREKQEKSQVTKVNFRCKNSGWYAFSLLLHYSNNNEYIEKLTKDPYLQSFLNNANLRPCCYHCNFKTVLRISDFTMADLWGIDNICPEWNDDKGVSLLIVHTNKGKEAIENAKSFCRIKQIDLEIAIKNNDMAIRSMAENPKREKFIQNIDLMEFDELHKKYGRPHYTLKNKVGKVLRSLGLRRSGTIL